MPLSTLKLNAKVLRELGLIDIRTGRNKGVKVTNPGRVVLRILDPARIR